LSRNGSPTKTARRRESAEGAAFNRREVADLLGVSLQAIDKAIEQGVVIRQQKHGETLIEREGLVVMAILGHAKVDLPVRVKQQVRRWVSTQRPHVKRGEQSLQVSDVITVHLSALVREVVAEAEEYAAARKRFIENNPQIFGGQPVIAGTRIPVNAVARRLEMGDTIETLEDDYPHVDPRAFEVAARYAKTHPRRGRPVKPWRERGGRRANQM